MGVCAFSHDCVVLITGSDGCSRFALCGDSSLTTCLWFPSTFLLLACCIWLVGYGGGYTQWDDGFMKPIS